MALYDRFMFFSFLILLASLLQLIAAKAETKTSQGNFRTTIPSIRDLLWRNKEMIMVTPRNERKQSILSRRKRDAPINCPDYLSCRNRSKFTTYPKNATDFCYCDSLCQAMQDCCHDYYLYKNTEEVPHSVMNSTWSCVKLGETKPVWMKTNCSKTWTEPVNAARCLNAPQTLNSSTFTAFLPVLGADNHTYRNQFCAVCNYQNEFEFWGLDVDVYPPGIGNVIELFDYLVDYYRGKKKGINDIVIQKDKSPRYCRDVISTCQNISKHKYTENENDCLFGKVGLIYRFTKLYKNVACVLCSNISTSDLRCEKRNGPGEGSLIPKAKDYDFYIIIDIRNAKTARFTALSSCGKGELFDNHLETCVDSSEVLPPNKLPLDKYRIALWLETNITLSIQVRSENISKFIYDVSPSNIHNPTNKGLVKNTYLLRFEVDLTFIQTVKSSNVSTSESFSEAYSIKKFIQPFSGVFYIRFYSVNVKVVKTTYRRLACFGLKHYSPSEYVEVGGKIFVNTTGKLYSNDEYFKDNSGSGIKVCEQQLPNECHGQYFKYNLNEFEVVQDNLSLYHKKEKLLYDYNKYSVRGDSIFICHEVSHPITGDTVGGFIAIIGISLSVISLLSVLITYSLFSQLRTPPGKNLMNLALVLLIFNLLWLSRGWFKYLRTLCVIMAFVQAYFILVSLTSMAKIAHDTMGMFTDPIAHQRRNTSSFLKFLIVWLMPVAHVVLCVILSQYSILTVNYETCWITGTHVYIVAVVPVCISMFYNIFCFTRSIIEMRKLEKNGQMLRAQTQEKSSVFVYIKISTLLGLGWSSTFIAAIFRVFSHMFVFLTTLQGVYIFLAFLCNKNVLMLYKRLCKGQSNSHQTISTRSTLRQSVELDKL